MGRPRSQLHTILLQMTDRVYFQPPSDEKMTYPCIRYQLDDVSMSYADNQPHRKDRRYLITIMDRNPDSSIPLLIEKLPLCSFSRFYAADNLNHFVYNLYF